MATAADDEEPSVGSRVPESLSSFESLGDVYTVSRRPIVARCTVASRYARC